MSQAKSYWVVTAAIPGIGTQSFYYLLKKYKKLQKFWEAPFSEIQKLDVDARVKNSIINFRKKNDPQEYLDNIYDKGIEVTCVFEREYPKNLKLILNGPPVLYYKGSLAASDSLALAVIGSRKSTRYGKEVTERFVSKLIKKKIVIVSGLARGIDSIAHKSALNNGGRTIAVLGHGLDRIYPPENKSLADEIVKNGAIVSEFPLGFEIAKSNFPARNRIISGLSQGVLVIEGAINSGSLITAGHAAEQGREVFAVPGPIDSVTSEGVNKLIKEGVHPATEVNDILEVLQI